MSPQSSQLDPDFRELSTRTFRLCVAMLRHESDAAEAAQEALMRSWAARKRKRPDTSWWTWVGGFAVRVCREVRRRRPFSDVQPDAEASTTECEPEPLVGYSELARRIYDVVAELPDRQREVVTLRWIVGFSTEQAAAVLGCPEGTIKSNLHKAVARLRETLSADAPREGETR